MGQIIGTQMEKSEHSYYSPAVQKVPDSDYAIVDLCHKGVLVTRRGQDGAHYPNTTPTVVAAAVAAVAAAVAAAVVVAVVVGRGCHYGSSGGRRRVRGRGVHTRTFYMCSRAEKTSRHISIY